MSWLAFNDTAEDDPRTTDVWAVSSTDGRCIKDLSQSEAEAVATALNMRDLIERVRKVAA